MPSLAFNPFLEQHWNFAGDTGDPKPSLANSTDFLGWMPLPLPLQWLQDRCPPAVAAWPGPDFLKVPMGFSRLSMVYYDF